MNENKVHTIDAVRDADALIEILKSGAAFPITVTGSSMTPYLKDGRDIVWLRKTDKLKRGQILFFRRRSGEFILHRIRKIYPDGRILINGDAQAWCEIISHDQALAAVVSVTRNGRRINPDGIGSKIWNAFWYPTRAFRPMIWKIYGTVRRVCKRQSGLQRKGNSGDIYEK